MIRAQGFTLLEMIGVLAVMAILAGALAPSVIQMVQRGYEDAEVKSLATLAQELKEYVRRTQSIPDDVTSDWVPALAEISSNTPDAVLENGKRFARRMYADPNFFTTTDQNFPGYSQDAGLVSSPVSPRIMLISNLDGPLNTHLNSATRFNDVWDQTPSAVIVESKTLLIERINLAPLFKRVVLSNASPDQVGYRLEGGAEYSVAAASGVVDGSRTIHIIEGSRLLLNAAVYPGGATLRQTIVASDGAYRYADDGGGAWSWE